MDSPNQQRSVWSELVTAFLKIGAMSYGGPAIMGIMQAELQEKRGWLTKERFLEGLALVNMLPGPGATQLGIFIGYNRAGWLGGLTAGLCFMLPAFFIMLTLTVLYATYGELPVMRDAFYGLGPVVLGIFAVAVYRLGKTAINNRVQVALAIAAALVFAATPLGVVTTLLLAGCVGVAAYHSRKWGLGAALAILAAFGAYHWGYVPIMAAASSSAAAPLVTPDLQSLGLFFFKVGAFTFGGGLTVLAFVQEQLVNQLQWLTPQEFLDGLALGQLTPGPILMLAAYVGYKLLGIGGAMVCAIAIFLPCFIVMLSILPVLARLRNLAWLKAAMRGVSAAVIGTLAVSLTQIAPHAVTDVPTLLLALLTVAAMLYWRATPLPLMVGGGAIGLLSRPLRRLKDFA
jgi:chromate transporter